MEHLQKIERILIELEGIDEERELNLAKELDEGISKFVEDCRKKKREVEYLGLRIDINKILADHLLEKYEIIQKTHKDTYTIFKKIMPTLVLCQLVINGIEDYNLNVLRKFSPLNESAQYVPLDVLLNSFYHGNSEIVKKYGVNV